MAVNNPKNNLNNERLIASSGTALIAGTGWAIAGYHSKPWLKNGMPSDSFIKNVEQNIAGNTDKTLVRIIKAAENYKSEVIKASSIENIADANIRFYTARMPGKTFDEVKSAIKTDLCSSLRVGLVPRGSVDTMLDYINDVSRASNYRELRDVLVENIEMNNYGSSLNQIKKELSAYIEEMQELSGLKSLNETAKEAVRSAYDAKTQKIVYKPENITEDLFKAVKKAAKGMQTRTAVLCGLMGAAVFGAAAYLMTKPNSSKK